MHTGPIHTRPIHTRISACTLALLIGALCAMAPAMAPAQTARPYLDHEPSIATWLPAQPALGDINDTRDIATFFATRPLAVKDAPRRAVAQADDVLSAPTVAARFGDAAGGPLPTGAGSALMTVMTRVLADDGAMLAQLKHDVRDGGRVRPYVRFPDQPGCDYAVDDRDYHLRDTGSYPSGHATYGWMWGLVLSHLVPERADAIMQRAYDFGQSRLICGFHYPADLDAGRLAASALFAQLLTDRAFVKDIELARGQVRKALGFPEAK